MPESVNHPNLHQAIWYQYRDHSRCCCKVHYDALPCTKCRPVIQICCLQGTHSSWSSVKLIFVRKDLDLTPWVPGDPCDALGSTNLCGNLYTYWENVFSSCVPDLILEWTVAEDCNSVQIRLREREGFAVGEWYTVGRDWYLTPLVIDDPIYLYQHSQDPDTYPLPAPTITIENCPVPTPVSFAETETIMLKAWLQRKSDTDDSWGPPTSGRFARGLGNCVSGTLYTCEGDTPPAYGRGIYWCWNFTTNKIVLSIDTTGTEASGTAEKEFDFSDCTWADTPFTVPIISALSGVTNYRWYVERIDDCSDEGSGPPDPPDPCDPGCWPPCVLCPSVKSMYVVVSQNPVCCFHGSFGLTYDSGSDTFYLPSPVGYSAGSCGGIRTFVMSCAGESSVTFEWTYRDEDGNDHTRTDTVSASCSDGAFETAGVEVLSTLISPALCSRETGRGASVRVISV